MEQEIMDIIMNAGNARTHCLNAVRSAINGDFEEADQMIKQAKKDLTKAHKTQTHLIKEEVSGNGKPVTLLMVHAQDHLMNALTVRDLAEIVIEDIKSKQEQINMLRGER